jgi:F-type H+-transporting ATPase subunit b
MIDLNATLFVQMVNFAIFLFILRKILFNPLVAHIQSRRDYLSSTEQKISSAMSKVEESERNFRAQLEEARVKAQDLINHNIAVAEQEKLSIVKAATAETRKVFDDFRNELATESQRVRAELQGEVESLARDIAGKILAVNTSDEKLLVQGGNQ